MAAPPPGYPIPENKGFTPYPPPQPAYGTPYGAAYPPQPAYETQPHGYGAPPQQYNPNGYQQSNGYQQPNGYPMNVQQQMPPGGAYPAGPYQAPGQMVMSQQQPQQAGAGGPAALAVLVSLRAAQHAASWTHAVTYFVANGDAAMPDAVCGSSRWTL